jgi:beta-galactosidase
MMPTYGGYPAAPWAQHTNQLETSENYLFNTGRRDPNVGTDLGLNAGANSQQDLVYRHPFFTVEMGVGETRSRITADLA